MGGENKEMMVPLNKTFGLLTALLVCTPVSAERFVVDNDWFRLRISTPAPSALAAFYEGRGFPKAMIEVLRKQCFINIGLLNKTNTIVWYDLSLWQFTTKEGPLTPYPRRYWQAQWQKLHIDARHQATFRWTLLPEQLDFRPTEAEAGNVVLPYTASPITIRGKLAVGDNKDKIIDFTFEEVTCGADATEQ